MMATTKTKTKPKADAYAPRLKERYEDELRAQLKDELGLSSIMEVPRIDEDHAEHGRRRGEDRAKQLDAGDRRADDRSPASARRCAAPASRSRSFKLREGMPIGAR